MKKRFLCLMLTLIMLVSLVPVTAISASAASLSTSGKAITVLKKMTTFKDTCYRVADTQEFRIGYGTICTGKHKADAEGRYNAHEINEAKADAALREILKQMDKKVNAFASANKLSLKQNQHDALAIFSYNVGTAWMNGNGAVKTAIVNGAGSNELLSAMATVQNDMARRKIEVNMYCNGVYSNVVPSTYRKVVYDAQGGTMIPNDGHPNYGQYTMDFDTTVPANHIPVPTKTGYKFLGWYTAVSGGKRVPTLNADCADQTLYAVWQDKTLKDNTDRLWEETPLVSYTFNASQLPSRTTYLAPNGKENEAGTAWLKDQKSVTIFTEYMDAKGVRWGNINGHGWVVMPGSSAAGSGSGSIECDVTVTVTNSYVNSRRNARISSTKNGSYSQGAKLRIINTASADGFLWGQVAKSADDATPIGWVALMYTNWNSVKDNGSSNGANNTTAIARATVTYNGYLNMRNTPGLDNNKIVGSLYKNETVDVYEIKTVNGHQWGRTNGGWFCLTYAEVTMLNGSKVDNISNEGALNYVFTGMLTNDTVAPKVSPRDTADDVQHYHKFEDKDKVKHTVDLWPKANSVINIHNMMIRGAATWVKISWRVDMDDNGEKDTTKYGWMLVDNGTQTYYEKPVSVAISTHPVQMDPVKFTVVSETTVRDNPGSGANAIPIKLNKGVEIQVNAIKLVGETIWGYIDNEHVRLSATEGEGDDDPTVDDGNNSEFQEFDGWVNLSSKYVTRSSLPNVGGDSPLTPTGKIATIVGSDNVNVRITGSTSGKRIGSLKRGTTANILEVSANGKWYNLDVDVDNNSKTGSWVYKDYVQVSDGTIGGGSNGSSDNAPAPVITGKGVVANTYSGVNVREGAGQGYKQVGKLLPGTIVDVLEIKQGGKAKWARIAQGWVCMDYITMLSQETTYPDGAPDNDGNTIVGSYDEIDRTTTTAVYTGYVASGTPIYATPEHHNTTDISFAIRTTSDVENITIYELLTVTEKIKEKVDDTVEDGDGSDTGHGSVVEKTVTSYWARVNDGYIYNPHDTIELDALDEKVHTLTGSDTLKVRPDANGAPATDGKPLGKLEKGDQVKVTALKIVYDKVWGRIEFEGEVGWIRLDYMSEGAYKVQEKPQQPETPAPSDPIIGAGGNNGGFVTNGSGYRYTGKVINESKVNVRAMPSTGSTITTTMKRGQSLVIYETTTAESMAWGRCDAGWIYLYYVDLTPATSNGAIDSRVVANNKAGIIFTDSTGSDTVGTYEGMSVIDVYEYVNGRARTDLGWITTDDLL